MEHDWESRITTHGKCVRLLFVCQRCGLEAPPAGACAACAWSLDPDGVCRHCQTLKSILDGGKRHD